LREPDGCADSSCYKYDRFSRSYEEHAIHQKRNGNCARRDDQVRNLSEGTDISKTVSSATRPPGHYTLKWDGKDNEGKLVKAGKYTVVVEASREHGTYQIERHEMNFDQQPQQATLPAGKELGAVTLDYRKR
jgi:FAD:protein FMN transferase